jgi:4-hydroxyphenylpyruvate dioxygenase-like putative hemolysin
MYIDHVADLYNANGLKEFCQWYQRVNPQVNELLQKAAEEEAKGGLDFSNVSAK